MRWSELFSLLHSCSPFCDLHSFGLEVAAFSCLSSNTITTGASFVRLRLTLMICFRFSFVIWRRRICAVVLSSCFRRIHFCDFHSLALEVAARSCLSSGH